MTKRILKVSIYAFIAFSIFFAFRLSIYLTYPEQFSELTLSETLLSFFTGFRVDAITIFTFTSLIILLLLVPAKWASNLKYQKLLSLGFCIIVILMSAALYGDFLYFEHVHRHTSSEILYLGGDASVAMEPLKAHAGMVLFLLLIFSVLLYLFWKIPDILKEETSFSLRNLALFFVIFIVLFASVRGKVVGKPFGIVDAFSTDKVASGHLALNGIYSVYRSSSRDGKAERFMEDGEALKLTKKLLSDPAFEFANEQYPLVRKLSKHSERPFKKLSQNEKAPNVVIILLEGWSSLYVDSFTHLGMGVTPNFDAIASEGIKFVNFYSNGQRSIDGITALFTGIPRVAGINRLGSGLEISEVSFLGDIAKLNGYQTLAMQSSKRSSFRLDAITRLAGFDEYYGAEDIPELHLETSGKQPYFGTWDNNTFQFLLNRINSLQQENDAPFLAFAFSSTTHTPFISPGKAWERYPHNDNDMFGFMNTLFYADDALGQFMEASKQQPWFKNTVFLFLADHTVGFGDPGFFTGKAPERDNENLRIPLVIYAPEFIEAGTYTHPASQADIIPSLVHLLSWQGEFSSISNSLFSEAPRIGLLEEGPVITYVNDKGYLKHNLDRALINTLPESDNEHELLAIYQTMSTLLQENRFFTKTEP